MVITLLNTLINHWGPKPRTCPTLEYHQKCIMILWSCKKFITVTNSRSSTFGTLVMQFVFALSREIQLWPSFFAKWRAFSYFNHLTGMKSFICGNSWATASMSRRKRTTSGHSDSLPDRVLSTTKTCSIRWALHGLLCRLLNISFARTYGSTPSCGLSAWLQTKNTGGNFSGSISYLGSKLISWSSLGPS